MGKMESALRDEITRLARKEIKAANAQLRKQVQELKTQLRKLKLSAGKAAPPPKQDIVLSASAAEIEATRIGPRWIRALRKRHKLSQGQLAGLLGVSMSAVGTWEYGRAKPAGANRAALVALRKLRPSELKRAMAGGAPAEGKAAKPAKKKAKKKAKKSAKKRGRKKG